MAVIESGNQTPGLGDVDALFQQLVVPGTPAIGATGGHYTVAGWTTAVVAAALAANTTLATMRFNPVSSRKAYVDRLRLVVVPATLGAAAGVAGVLGLQRFTAALPTGGNARTPNRQQEDAGTTSDMYDIRDSNAALTVTSVVFGNIVAVTPVPLFVASGALWFEWIYEPPRPTKMNPGDGLALRTQMAMAATQTWLYAYTYHYFEK